MLNDLLTKTLTIGSVVLGLYAAACISQFERASAPALLLALASAVSFFNFGYLVYVQTKNEN